MNWSMAVYSRGERRETEKTEKTETVPKNRKITPKKTETDTNRKKS